MFLVSCSCACHVIVDEVFFFWSKVSGHSKITNFSSHKESFIVGSKILLGMFSIICTKIILMERLVNTLST